ncbi:MAG: hypothetical protein LBC86_00825 [Oscillospiraceae bacterium]|jgi:hypothetical protein|nr:hypothetical protein [Oscillospiraceae bacterium]
MQNESTNQVADLETKTKPIDPVFFARGKNSKLLGNALNQKIERALIGSTWSLRRIMNSDLKNYKAQSHFVIDFSAFVDSREEFTAALEDLCKIYSGVIVLYFDDLCVGDNGDEFLDTLVRSGFTNIVAGYSGISEKENIKLILADLAECFTQNGLSEQKYSRYLIQSASVDNGVDESSSDTTLHEVQGQIPQNSLTLNVFGSQHRIGTTTFALGLCEYCVNQGGRALLVLCATDSDEEFGEMRGYFGYDEKADVISHKGFDITTDKMVFSAADYNLVVYDCGEVSRNAELVQKYDTANFIFLCCGIGYKEHYLTATAQHHLNGVEYTAVVNTDNEENCRAFGELLSKNLNEYVCGDFRDMRGISERIMGVIY